MKCAGRETRHLRVLASAWEIQEVEHYAKLVRHLHKDDYMNYKEYTADEEDDDINTADSLMAYNHKLYNEQLVSIGNVDSQLDQLEEVVRSHATFKNPHHSPYESDHDNDKSAESEDDNKAGDKMARWHMN